MPANMFGRAWQRFSSGYSQLGTKSIDYEHINSQLNSEERNENATEETPLLAHSDELPTDIRGRADQAGGGASLVGNLALGAPGHLASVGQPLGVAVGSAASVAAMLSPAVIAGEAMSMAQNLAAAGSTYMHMSAIRFELENAPSDTPDDLAEAVAFVLHKKNAKLKIKGWGGLPLVGKVVTIVANGVALNNMSATSVERKDYAETLWVYATMRNDLALAVIAELIGQLELERLLALNPVDAAGAFEGKMKATFFG